MIIENQTQTPNGLWRIQKYDLAIGKDAARYVARTRYAWPGGYEMFAICSDGEVLCCDCCKTEYSRIAGAHRGSGWDVIAIDSTANCEIDRIFCAHCNRMILEEDTSEPESNTSEACPHCDAMDPFDYSRCICCGHMCCGQSPL